MNNKEGGFECEFVEKPPKAFQSECPVCLLVLREPYQATCCGYSFCRVCIEQIKERNISCPCCKADEFDHYPNKGLQRSLNEFKVQCSNKQQGCQWEGELGQLDNHLNYNPTKVKQLQGCKFSKIECLYCSIIFIRSDIQPHQSDHCPRRPFSCEYCKGFDSTHEDVTINHWSVCGYYPIPCPNKCGKPLQRQNLDSHTTNDCSLTIIDCNFQYVGCEVRLPRKDMSAHLEERMLHHMSLHVASSKQVEATVARLEEENETLRQQVVQLTQDLQMQQICTPICPLEFTMTNFEQKQKDDERWQSPPFYTRKNGYKMCLCVYANGCANGKGTHISIYIALMKGERDDWIKWPFRGKLQIQLLYLNKDEGHCKETVDFGGAYIGGAGNRVTVGEVSIQERGFFDFISCGDLRPKYLNSNNCLRFHINSKE